MSDRDELHRLVDELPDDLAGQVLDFVEYIRERRQVAGPRDEDRAWEFTVASDLADRLDAFEADVDPEVKRAWFEAFRQGGRPCRYVPGEGFIAL